MVFNFIHVMDTVSKRSKNIFIFYKIAKSIWNKTKVGPLDNNKILIIKSSGD